MVEGTAVVEKTLKEGRNIKDQVYTLDLARHRLAGYGARTFIYHNRLIQEFVEVLGDIEHREEGLLHRLSRADGNKVLDEYFMLHPRIWRRGIFDLDIALHNYGRTLEGNIVVFDYTNIQDFYPGSPELTAASKITLYSNRKFLPPWLVEDYDDKARDFNDEMEEEFRRTPFGKNKYWEKDIEEKASWGILGFPHPYLGETKKDASSPVAGAADEDGRRIAAALKDLGRWWEKEHRAAWQKGRHFEPSQDAGDFKKLLNHLGEERLVTIDDRDSATLFSIFAKLGHGQQARQIVNRLFILVARLLDTLAVFEKVFDHTPSLFSSGESLVDLTHWEEDTRSKEGYLIDPATARIHFDLDYWIGRDFRAIEIEMREKAARVMAASLFAAGRYYVGRDLSLPGYPRPLGDRLWEMRHDVVVSRLLWEILGPTDYLNVFSRDLRRAVETLRDQRDPSTLFVHFAILEAVIALHGRGKVTDTFSLVLIAQMKESKELLGDAVAAALSATLFEEILAAGSYEDFLSPRARGLSGDLRDVFLATSVRRQGDEGVTFHANC